MLSGAEKKISMGFITPSVPGRVMSCSPVGGMQCLARNAGNKSVQFMYIMYMYSNFTEIIETLDCVDVSYKCFRFYFSVMPNIS